MGKRDPPFHILYSYGSFAHDLIIETGSWRENEI